MSDKQSRPSTALGRQVITPGGPRPADMVHGVAPGEAVAMDEAGRPKIVIGPSAASAVSSDTVREHSEGRLSNAMGRALRATDVPAVSGFVLTPGGFRPRSLVQRVQPGETLHVQEDRVLVRNLETNTLREVPLVSAPFEHLPALGSGWITYAYWNNGTGNTLTSFRTTWEVPPAPVSQDSQTIFLFNGIQNNGSNFGILQPVLQWGASAAGGGPYWSIASWYVTSGGQAFYTPLVRVNSGDTLVGVMRLTGRYSQKVGK